MSTAATPAAPQQAGTPSRGRPHYRRRPNRNTQVSQPGDTEGQEVRPENQDGPRRGGRRPAGRGNALSMRPASVTPASTAFAGQVQSAGASSAENSATEAPRGPRHVRNSQRGGGAPRQLRNQGRPQPQQQQQQTRIVNGRHFGGNLTMEEDEASSQLNADAPAFEPSQQYNPGSAVSERRPAPKQKQRRASKSTAPDILTRTHEDIDHRQYECAICTDEVLRYSKVWSCRTCWSVFHLKCIKKWSTNEGSATPRPQQGQDGYTPRQWRCPGCNLPKDTLPSVYTCWCEKEVEPRSQPGLPPHSCGNTCGRERLLPKKCPHPCDLTCHAGPCPPCPYNGPVQTCFCGKKSQQRRCIETDYEHGFSCGEVCGDLMPCGEHTCERPCHEGLCGACEVRIDARCYCGQEEKAIICAERGDEKESKREYTTETGENVKEEWTGMFECGNLCNRAFDCGKHHCEKTCHPATTVPAHCPRSPDIVTHCPCGKTKLSDISDKERTSCEDPIPNCRKACGKPLACGHPCEQPCHTGACFPCMKITEIKCRCGRTTTKTVCHQGLDEPPQCFRVCKATLNCGRHECGERCCPGEKKAIERQASRRKGRPLDSAPRIIDDSFEAEHICTRPCGRPLKCGNHTCQELCHRGPCGSCREAIFDEVTCDCGRTVLHPPLPCGTKPPPCRFPCQRPKDCGHPQVQHNCHLDDEACPKCPYLTEKPCACGKHILKNQQCWLTDVRCGEKCGRKLKCGAHFCQKSCHPPGQCEDADTKGLNCSQLCGKEKRACGHPCEDRCHAPYPCKEDKPCTHKIFITCECQHNKQEARCNATKSSEGNTKKSLPCTDECARLERNRKLAMALNVDPDHKDDHVPYSTETLSLFQQAPQWSQTQEREFRVFAASPEEKRLRFKPMPSHHRAFIHALAEDFGLDSESLDPEPHRHVAVFKTPRFVSAPNKTLAECVRIRKTQSAALAAAQQERKAEKLRASNMVGDPYNAYLLTNPRFGLILEEIRSEIAAVVPASQDPTFDISFLPSEEVVLKASAKKTGSATPSTERDLEDLLKNFKPALITAIKAKGLGTLQLCRVDDSLNVLRRESDNVANGGWSQVAAKAAAAPRRAPQPGTLGSKGGFAALMGNGSMDSAGAGAGKSGSGSGKLTLRRKKEVKREESVVDDWEKVEEELEERERREESARVSKEGSVVGSANVSVTGSAAGSANVSGDEAGFADAVEEGGEVMVEHAVENTDAEGVVDAVAPESLQ